jgi:hypothetical protein
MAVRLPGGGEGVTAVKVVAAFPDSLLQCGDKGFTGLAGLVGGWFDLNAASGQLPRWRWR